MKKGSAILLSVCALSLCMVLGIFIGRNLRDEYAVLPQDTTAGSICATEEQYDFRMDINTATKNQLMELPGIGELIAQRIIDYRQNNGLFQETDDLLNIEGIGNKKLQAIEERIKVGG